MPTGAPSAPRRPTLSATVAICLLTASLAVASELEEPLFRNGFESGDLCGWSAASGVEITGFLPALGSAGTRIGIGGSGFGDTAPTVFLSRRRSHLSGVALAVVELRDDLIVAEVPSGAPVGDYFLSVIRCPSYVLAASAERFGVRLPEALDFAPEFVVEGGEVAMSGRFLGFPPGTISIRSQRDPIVGELPVELASWVDGFGDLPGRAVFTMPSPLSANGPYDVGVVNGIGRVVASGGLVVIGVADGDDEPLRVVAAVATSNTEVLVQFDEAVQGGSGAAENPAHYRIAAPQSATAIGEKASTVGVLEAVVLRPELSTVRLTTRSQSDLLYTLTVVNVRDLAGNPIAPPQLGVPNPSAATFVGIPPGGGGVDDSDGDGLSDADEQRGWIISVAYADGHREIRHVTSDPGDPRYPVDDPVNVAARDTDGDGVTDNEEKHGAMDPRSPDTDGDVLTDDEEWNTVFSDPGNQDTDGDGVQDGFEFFTFRTSPILADTDGDQLLDPDEVVAGNRNPLLADLPSPRIRIGNVSLQLDTRFTFTDEAGESVSEERSVESTLTRGENETFSTSNENSTKSTLEFSQELSATFNSGGGADQAFPGVSVTASAGSKQGSERGSTFTVGEESGRSSEEAYHDSLTTSTARDVRESVTREIVGAAVRVDVSIDNTGDVPFTISNLELTAQTQDPNDRRRVIPVASLVPENEGLGSVNIGSLGDPSRGPFVFKTDSVFPQQVQELMKNPRGFVVQLANFDITDESGRNFAFVSQEVLDRTAGITFDLGDGRVESYRVATASAHDPATGRPLGITMEYALGSIIGLHRRSTIQDGGDGLVSTAALGDDVQEVAVGRRVEPGRVLISAGPDGVLDTAALFGDDVTVRPDYETALQTLRPTIQDGGNGRVDTAAAGDDIQEVSVGSPVGLGQAVVTAGVDGILDTAPAGDDAVVPPKPPHRVLSRFRDVASEVSQKRFWVLYTTRDLPAVDLDEIVLRAGEQYDFAYVQDTDADGVWAREEFLHGSQDSVADSDGDDLTDRLEIQEGWRVQLRGSPEARRVYPNPAQRDSDRDQLEDREEQLCALDPRQRDSDLDGLSDWEEVRGRLLENGDADGNMVTRDPVTDAARRIEVYSGDPDGPGGFVNHDVGDTPGCNDDAGFATDPRNPDTDGDGVDDGVELGLGIHPNDPEDGGSFLDDDGDGVPNTFERRGFFAVVDGVVQVAAFTSNPADPDSDDDGLPDLLEHFLKSDPRSADTDGDGLSDTDEYRNGGLVCVTDHADADGNGEPDGLGEPCIELAALIEGNFRQYLLQCEAADVCNNPAIEQDLLDLGSLQLGTNLNETDTDFDTVEDGVEVREDLEITVDGNPRVLAAPASDPLLNDTDGDGLRDDVERRGLSPANVRTDPRSDNTDGDDVLDGREVAIGTNPAQRDKRVTFSFTSIAYERDEDIGDCDDDDDGEIGATYQVVLFRGGGQDAQNVLSLNPDCSPFDACRSDGDNLLLQASTSECNTSGGSRTITLVPGDTVTMQSVNALECDGGSANDDMNDVERTFDFSVTSTNESQTHSAGGEECFDVGIQVNVVD